MYTLSRNRYTHQPTEIRRGPKSTSVCRTYRRNTKNARDTSTNFYHDAFVDVRNRDRCGGPPIVDKPQLERESLSKFRGPDSAIIRLCELDRLWSTRRTSTAVCARGHSTRAKTTRRAVENDSDSRGAGRRSRQCGTRRP